MRRYFFTLFLVVELFNHPCLSFTTYSISSRKFGTRNPHQTLPVAPIPAIPSAEVLLAPQVPLPYSISINAVLFTALSPLLLKSLTVSGLLNAFLLGCGLYATLGWKGWSLCVLYLAAGNIVTKVQFEEKEKRGLAESRGGRRGPENVWGSALTGLICATCSFLLPPTATLFQLGYVSSLATKLADTFASEIGKAYGKTTFLITTFQRVEPGTEGAVSLEGSLASVAGGALLALYGKAVGLLTTWPAVVVATIAAFVATNVESVLGATLQGRIKWMTNEVVNGINTLVGALIAMTLGVWFLDLP